MSAAPLSATLHFVRPQRGRGALTNLPGRLDQTVRAVSPEWLNHAQASNELAPLVRTQVQVETARSIISKNQSPDIPFVLSVNPYRGCEHGCFYCYARPNHSYVNLSPGLDFETKLFAKTNTVALLRHEISQPRHVVSPINLGAVTDCYQPIERDYRLTRGVLELLSETHHPVTIVTKNALIERDLDILASMAKRNLVQVFISLTSLEASLSQKMEPRASAPWRRLAAVKSLVDAGVPVGVLVAPIIPFINEPEIEAIVEAAAKVKASSVHYTVLRMPWELKDMTRDWLELHFPDRAQRVLHRIQDMRGGRDNDTRFTTRMKGEGVWAQLIKARFHAAMRRWSMVNQRLPLDCRSFVAPPIAANLPPKASNRLPPSQLSVNTISQWPPGAQMALFG
jgi:DNA repair photolyase